MTTRGTWILSALGFAFFFVGLWCFVLWVIAHLSGWTRLARFYGGHTPMPGETLRFVSARVGFTNYNGTLHLGLSELGLCIVPMRIFRAFHPPLDIPWSDVIQARDAVGPNVVVLSFTALPDRRWVFYGRAARRLDTVLKKRADLARFGIGHDA